MAISNRKRVETVLVTALAAGATVASAALQAGVSERTVYRRLKNPAFEAQIQAIQDDTLQRSMAILIAANLTAVQSMVALQAENMRPSVRRAAAHDSLNMSLRLRAIVEFEKRLLALETQATDADAAAVQAGPTPPPPATKRRRRGDGILQAALASGATVSQAASKAGLHERTVYRRLQDATFQRYINALRADILQRASAMLIAASRLAVKTLIDLQDPKTPAFARLGAARDIFEMGERLRQATSVEKRLCALEEW